MPRVLPAGLGASEGKTSRNFLRLFKVVLANYAATLRFVESDLSRVLDVGDGAGAVQWGATVGITRGATEQTPDLKVDTMHVTIPNQDFLIPGIGTKSLNKWAALGVFENATVSAYVYDLDTLTSSLWSTWVIQGSPSWDYAQVSFILENMWALADRHIPRTIIQEQCNNKLFDRFCTLVQSDWTVQAHLINTPGRLEFDYNVDSSGPKVPATIPDQWFDLGFVTFKTGAALAPLSRMVLHQTGTHISLATNLPFAPNTGDPVSISAGCDKTAATCQSKFNNLANFRGFPYAPKPDAIYDI